MNQRNIGALMALIEDFQNCVARGYVVGSYAGQPTAEALAESLATSGVLVPSTMTNEQMNEIPAHILPNPYQLVGVLERIAKGGTA